MKYHDEVPSVRRHSFSQLGAEDESDSGIEKTTFSNKK